MLKTSSIKIIFVNIFCISCLNEVFRCISGINLSPTSKNVFTIHSFYTSNKTSPNNGTLLNGIFKLKLVNDPFNYCSFINFDFLLPHTAHFDDKNALPFLVFNIFESALLVYFLHFKQYVSILYN